MIERSVILKRIIIVILSLLIVGSLVLTHFIASSKPDDTENSSGLGYGEFVYKGVTYRPAQYRLNLLLIGVDATGKADSSGTYMNTGLSDFLCLLSFDLREKNCTAIHINRDTITKVPMYSVSGSYIGKAPMQIALSHQYGTGMEDSCLNTVQTVSSLFNGITIDYYVAFHMDGIPSLNDAVGGIEVTIEDDFSAVDSTMKMGETIVLSGAQAETYIRGRQGVADQTNLNRMNRQKVYVEKLYDKIAKNSDLFETLFDSLGDYLVTNVSVGTINQYVNAETQFPLKSSYSLPGTPQVVGGIMEFHVDEDGLQDLLSKTLYTKK